MSLLSRLGSRLRPAPVAEAPVMDTPDTPPPTPPEDQPFEAFVMAHLDGAAYLDAYPDVRAAGLDPVRHWLEYGMAEGRFLYPGVTVVRGAGVARLDSPRWQRFTWRGTPVAVRIATPLKPALMDQILAQARHDPAVLAVGAPAIPHLRQLDGPDLLTRGGVDIRDIVAAIPERPDTVVVLPHLRADAADPYAADLVSALAALRRKPLLVIATQGPADTAPSGPGVRGVCWPDLCGLNARDPHFLARLLHVLRPERIVVLDDALGLEMVARFGRGLGQSARLYCAYRSPQPPGLEAPLSARFAPRTLPHALALTDHADLADTLRRQWGALPGPGIAVLPPRGPAPEDDAYPDTVAALFGDPAPHV